MLSFLVTDANIKAPLLQRMLEKAAEDSYNRITVDGETSTNDTVLLLANGKAGHPPSIEWTGMEKSFNRCFQRSVRIWPGVW